MNARTRTVQHRRDLKILNALINKCESVMGYVCSEAHRQAILSERKHTILSTAKLMDFTDSEIRSLEAKLDRIGAVEDCPKGCKHETLCYCNAAGTHCRLHCVCPCKDCTDARKNPPPIDPKLGGYVLPGSNVVGL